MKWEVAKGSLMGVTNPQFRKCEKEISYWFQSRSLSWSRITPISSSTFLEAIGRMLSQLLISLKPWGLNKSYYPMVYHEICVSHSMCFTCWEWTLPDNQDVCTQAHSPVLHWNGKITAHSGSGWNSPISGSVNISATNSTFYLEASLSGKAISVPIRPEPNCNFFSSSFAKFPALTSESDIP